MKATIIGWSETTLREHVDLLAGFAFKSEKFTDAPSDIPLVKGANVQQGYIDWENSARWPCSEYDNHKKYHLRTGDVVVAMDRPWVPSGLKYAWIKPNSPKSLLVQRVARLRARNSLLQSYLRYIIGSREFSEYLRRVVTGVNVPHISGAQIQFFQFHLPPLKAQRKIASILSAYDDLIENNRRRIAILEEMAGNLYREWFVKFRFPIFRDDGTIERIHDPERDPMQPSPLGPIPEGWGVKAIGELYRTSSGGTPSRKKPEYYGGGIPWLKTKELNDCHISTTEESITELGLKKSSAKLFPRNTVIIAMYGATIGQLGILDIECSTNQACCALLPKVEGFGHTFAFLTLTEYRQKLIGLGQGAAQQNISQAVIKAYEIITPPAKSVIAFAGVCDSILDQICLRQKQSTCLGRTRDHLLPKLISGQVDVSELDMDVPAEVE